MQFWLLTPEDTCLSLNIWAALLTPKSKSFPFWAIHVCVQSLCAQLECAIINPCYKRCHFPEPNILCSEILITLGCTSRKKILLWLRKPENYIIYNPFHLFNVLIKLPTRNPLKVAREKLPETCSGTCRSLPAKCLLWRWKIHLFCGYSFHAVFHSNIKAAQHYCSLVLSPGCWRTWWKNRPKPPQKNQTTPKKPRSLSYKKRGEKKGKTTDFEGSSGYTEELKCC